MAFQQMQCHNCNSNGISAKTKSLKMCRKCAENVLKMCHVYLLLHTKSNLPPAPPPSLPPAIALQLAVPGFTRKPQQPTTSKTVCRHVSSLQNLPPPLVESPTMPCMRFTKRCYYTTTNRINLSIC
jgi:hypothetical protein